MEWLFIILILWAISAYLYRTSTFTPTNNLEEEYEYIEYKFEQALANLSIQPSDSKYDRTESFIFNPDLHNQFMSAQQKATYLASPEWQTRKLQVLTRDNFRCKSCGSSHNLECHHISYTYLGTEPLSHLVTLCRSCHQKIHDKLGYDRTTYYPIQ